MAKEPLRRQLLIALGCVVRGDEFLLTQRNEPEQADLDRTWELPGGKVMATETPEQAAVREVREETGFEVEISDQRPFGYTTPYWRYADGHQRAVLLCYECHLSNRQAAHRNKRDHRVRDIRWHHFSEIDFARVIGGSRELIWWIAERRGIANQLSFFKSEPEYVHFEHHDPAKGSKKFYTLTIEVNTISQLGYVLRRTWGRIGFTPRHISEAYETDINLRRRLLELVNQRIAHGYLVTEVSDNFPLKEWLEKHPATTIGSTRQLLLWDHYKSDPTKG